MKAKLPTFRVLAPLLAVVAFVHSVNAATNIWTGPSGGDWSTPGNWTPSGPPGSADEARFFDPGAVADATLDNIVSVNTFIQRLWIGQTNNVHNMGINAGVTLSIVGTDDNGYGVLGSDPDAGGITPDPVPTRYQSSLYVGTKSTSSQTQIVRGTVSGEGTLSINNTNNEILIRQFHPSGGAHRAILDLSGLNSFVANLGRIRVGDGEAQPLNRSEGQLYLAKTNTITLTGPVFQDNVQLVVGNNDVNQNQGNPSLMVLGGKNTIYVDEVLVGGKKQPGTLRSTNAFSTLSLLMRGSDGVSRVRALRFGDAADQPTSGNGTTGIGSFTDVTVDILADTITVGKSQSTGGGNGSLSTGNFLLGPGTLDVNTLDLAFRMDNCTSINSAAGNVSFSNTTVAVNNLLRLGRMGGGTVPPNATLTVNGGTTTVRSNVIIEGAATINVVNGSLLFVRPANLALNNLTLNGSTISNTAGTLRVTNTLSILNNGVVLGNPAFDMGNNPATTWDVTGVTGGALTVNNSFQGGGTVNGNLLQGTGGIVGAGGNGTVGALTVSGNMTLNAGTLRFDLSNSGLTGNDQILALGSVTQNATNDVFLTAVAGALDTANPYTLISAASLVGNQNNFKVAGPLAQSRYTFAFDTTSTPNAVKLIVGGAGGANLVWSGDGVANTWNTVAFNWDSGASKFFSLDNVTFNDSGSVTPAVNLSGTLIPGLMTVNNTSAKNYTFGGSGGLAASGMLIKTGNGSLTFNNTAGNSFSSLVAVSNGVVTFANSGVNAFNSGLVIEGGAVVFSGNSTNVIANVGNTTVIAGGASLSVINAGANSFGGAPITLEGTLTFNQAADANLDGDISGAGTLIKNGGGKLTITGNNSALTSVVQINAGTVEIGTTTALGTTGVIVTNSATLDLVGRNLGPLPATVSGTGVGGNGAIVSSGAPLVAGTASLGFTTLTLAGNTTVGGSGPWDTDPVKNLGQWGVNGGSLSTGGNARSLTKVGSNQIGLTDTSVDAALGEIDVQQGLLAFQGGTDSMGNPASNIIVRAGATVSFYNTATAWDKKFVLFGNGTTPNLFNYNGANTIIGPVTLNGNCVIGAAPAARGAPVSLALNGPIGGTGNLIKAGQLDAVILGGTNNYSGNTIVISGKLTLDGRNLGSGLLTNVAGTTISGIGSNTGPVVINGTLSPGNDSTPTATFGTGPLTLNSATVVCDVDTASDLIEVNGNLTLNGSIGIQLVPGFSLTVGQIIPLIHYSGSLLGSTNSFQLLSLPPGFTANLYSNANTIGIVIGHLPVNKTWRGGALAGPTFWDTTTTNWDRSGTPDRYDSGDIATFDDTGLTNLVTLVGTLTPASITLNNSVNYSFGGSGRLSGLASLDMLGAGSLIITNSGNNDFTGPITINSGAGMLLVGSGGANGTIGSGFLTNFTAVVFNRSGTVNINNRFFETGVVTNTGGGIHVLGGDNSLADMNITVLSGTTLRPATGTALGRNTGTTLVQSGAVLDVNGQNLGAKSVTISGSGISSAGAIINSGAAQISALQSLVLQGNTTFGGANRWDLRAGTVASLDTGGQPFNITKTGANQVSLVSITNIDAALADIDILQGTFSIQNFTGQLGDPTKKITVRSNATMSLFGLNLFPLDKVISVYNGGIVGNESGDSVIIGSMSLTGRITFAVAAGSLTITNNNALTAGGPVTNIIKNGAGTLRLINNALPSATLLDIAAGTIDLNQSLSSTVTLGSGQTIRGNGNLAGSLIAGAGSTVTPGPTLGTLTISNSITLAGTNIMEINKATASSDLLRTSGSIAYGGRLVVTNLSGTFIGGETFKLFNAASYSGMFATNLPALAAGLVWNTNNLTVNGTISINVITLPPPTIASVVQSGTNLVFSGTNNFGGNGAYYVLASTNVALPRSSWTRISTNNFVGGAFSVSTPITPGTPQRFYTLQLP